MVMATSTLPNAVAAPAPMRLLKSLSLSAFSMGVRFAAALLAFSIVARVLGPSRFGVLMLCLSIASLLALVSNFGLVVLLLREIGRDASAAPAVLGRTLSAKLLVTTVALLIGGGIFPLLAPEARWPYALMLLAMLAEGFTEFFSAGFRASQRFDVEARLALAGGLVQLFGVALVAWWTESLLWISSAYLLTRCLVAMMAYGQLLEIVGPLRLAGLREAGRQARGAISYAVDAGLTSAFGQVDSLVLNHFLGPIAVGLHQAGMRLFMAGTQAAAVLANVFLPRAAAAQARSTPAAQQAENLRLQLAFVGVGAVFGWLLALAGGRLVMWLFGTAFDALALLMPWFGLLFAMKFVAAAWGVVLTAKGLQTYRAMASAVHWLVIAGLAALLVPPHGNVGWLWALTAGTAVLALLYAGRAFERSRTDMGVLLATLLMLASFVPLLGLG